MFANLLYFIALAAVSPVVLLRMLRHGRYRRGIHEKLFGISAKKARRLRGLSRCIWIHAVSVGEVNLLSPLLAHLLAHLLPHQRPLAVPLRHVARERPPSRAARRPPRVAAVAGAARPRPGATS